jgi:hypothetical protein
MVGGVAVVCLGIATGLMAHAYQQENQALEAAMKVNATSEDFKAQIDTRTSIRNQWIAGVVLFSTGGSLAISTAGLSFATEWR